MEGKEEQMLGGAIVNYLFLSQFELMRATLLSLGERNPRVARDIYRAIVLQVWKLKGIVWSESVPSSAHLAWMCLQELQAMEEKLLDKGDGSHEEVLASGEILDYQLSSRDNWWSLHCQPIYDGIEFLLFMEFLKTIVLENGDAIASDIMGEAIVESGEGGVERESVNGAEEDLKDVKKAGLQLMEKIVAAGVDQLNRTLQFVTGCVSEGDREDQENNNEKERQVGDKDVGRNVHSIEESTTTQTLGGGNDILSGMERKWLLFLTLRHPELLDVLCQNIWRQQQQQSDDLDLPAMVSSGRDLDGSNNSEKAAEEEAANDNPADKTGKLSQLCKDFEVSLKLLAGAICIIGLDFFSFFFFFSETQQLFLGQIGCFVCADGFSHPKGSTACTSAANHGGCEGGPTGESSSALAVPP
jgi:hypothetical protein